MGTVQAIADAAAGDDWASPPHSSLPPFEAVGTGLATVAATRADARAAGLFEVEEFEQRALEVFLQRVWKHAEILAEEVIVPGKDLIH